MSWVYIRSEPGLWTVGFYSPDEKWHPESDHGTPGEAAERVHYLNGATCEYDLGSAIERITALEGRLHDHEQTVPHAEAQA